MMDIDINNVKFETDIPIIGRLKDDLFEYNGYDHVRYTSRALLENSKGEFGFLHIVGEDFFGVRDHLETCGGGIEENEDLYDTIIREVKEEMGYNVEQVQLIGGIIDSYNLINRITFSTFFHCYVDESNKVEIHRTEEESILIKEILWLKPLDALDYLKNKGKSNVDKIVHRRDYLALKYYLENYTDILKNEEI